MTIGLSRRSFLKSAAAVTLAAPFAGSLTGWGVGGGRHDHVGVAALGGFDLAWQAGNFEEITEPRMAESWEVTNGGRTYTFSLRKGWPSHAGNEFTAADVKGTFDRSFALHGITSFYNTLSTIERPEDVTVLDKHTVRIELAEPGPD